MIFYEHVGIRNSAFKHGLTRENILHAIRNRIGAVVEVADDPLVKYEFVGVDAAGNEIELAVEMVDPYTPVVIHAMKRRRHFPRRRRH